MNLFRGGRVDVEGRVSGSDNSRIHRERMSGLKAIIGGMLGITKSDIYADTTDHFSGQARFDETGDISLENAAAWEEGISDYAAGHDITGQDGVVPCDLVGRPRDAKFGKESKKRKWFR